MYYVHYTHTKRALISLRLTRITSCFANSAARSGVTPLILRASNTTTRFSSSSINQLLQFHLKITPETISEGQNSKISFRRWGWGGIPPDPLVASLNDSKAATTLASRCSSRTLPLTHCPKLPNWLDGATLAIYTLIDMYGDSALFWR